MIHKDEYSYIGSILDGKRDGVGMCVLNDYTHMEEQDFNGLNSCKLYDGDRKGVISVKYYPDLCSFIEFYGGMYYGEWLDNKRHGYGTYVWMRGEDYEGNYVVSSCYGLWQNGAFVTGYNND